MHCPYCVSAIDELALVCPTCRRDLQLVRQLQEKIAQLEAQLAAAGGPVAAAAAGDAPVGADEALALEPEVVPPPAWGQAILACVLPLALLLPAHWLIIFVYDARPLYLHLLAMLLPLPCGLLLDRALRLSFGWSLLPAFATATAAVFAMSALTGWIDGVPVMPQNMVEVREFIEFALSIGLSFTTGLWLAQWVRRRRAAQRERAAERRRLGTMAMQHGQNMADTLSRLNDIGSAVVAFATTAISIYTGLKGVLGS